MIIEHNGNRYIAQCGCIKTTALEYVMYQLEMKARCIDSGIIEVELAEGVWLPSAYLFLDDMLYKKIN